MPNSNDKFADLRRRAEALVQQSGLQSQKRKDASTPDYEDYLELLIELDTHRAELELQYRQLQELQQSLTRSRHTYKDLFENAPNGFLICDIRGRIQLANRAIAGLLGTDIHALQETRVANYIAKDERDAYHRYQRRLLSADSPRSIRLLLLRADNTRQHVQFYGSLSGSGSADDRQIRLCIIPDNSDTEPSRQDKKT